MRRASAYIGRHTCPAFSGTLLERFWYAAGMDKARIAKARRAAERQGFRLRRSRTKDELALDYGWHLYNKDSREVAHLRTLESAEQWLADPDSR